MDHHSRVIRSHLASITDLYSIGLQNNILHSQLFDSRAAHERLQRLGSRPILSALEPSLTRIGVCFHDPIDEYEQQILFHALYSVVLLTPG